MNSIFLKVDETVLTCGRSMLNPSRLNYRKMCTDKPCPFHVNPLKHLNLFKSHCCILLSSVSVQSLLGQVERKKSQ